MEYPDRVMPRGCCSGPSGRKPKSGWWSRDCANLSRRAWLRSAANSKLKEFVGFARGISEDYGAVRNALTYEWSNGPLEGGINRLKLIKRGMCVRAKFDSLRARVLYLRS
jgi:transposase